MMSAAVISGLALPLRYSENCRATIFVAAASLVSCRPKRRTRRAGTPAGGLHCPFGKTGARLGKARITSLAIPRFRLLIFKSQNALLFLLTSYFLILPFLSLVTLHKRAEQENGIRFRPGRINAI